MSISLRAAALSLRKVTWWGSGNLRALGLGFLSMAVMIHLGERDPLGFIFLLPGIGLTVAALWAPRLRPEIAVWNVVLLMCIIASLYNHIWVGIPSALPLCGIGLPLCFSLIISDRRWQIVGVVIALGSAVAMSIAAIFIVTSTIDVFTLVQGGASLLLHGKDLYGYVLVPDEHFYFTYGPSIAILAIPGRILGDVRFMSVVAAFVIYSGIFILGKRTQPDFQIRLRMLALCAALPVTAAMVHNSFVDIYTVAGFCLWAVLRDRHRVWAVIALAVALAGKPTIAVALVPMMMWSTRMRTEIVFAVGSALLIFLPFGLMAGFGHLWSSIAGLEIARPIRSDTMSLNGLLTQLRRPFAPSWIWPLALAAGALIVALRAPKTWGDLYGKSAVFAICAFFFAKWAYFHYWFIPIILLFLAIVTEDEILTPQDRENTLSIAVRK